MYDATILKLSNLKQAYNIQFTICPRKSYCQIRNVCENLSILFWNQKYVSLEICLFKKHAMKIASYDLVSQIFSLLIYFCSNFLKNFMFNWPSDSTEAPDVF